MTSWTGYLKAGSRAEDRLLFRSWERGNITTTYAIIRFKASNRIPDYVMIDREAFIEWLNGLGYRRNGSVTKE